jgi:hypothetical protein
MRFYRFRFFTIDPREEITHFINKIGADPENIFQV